MLLKTVKALEINQASISQPESRNVVQGHRGELSNIGHSSLILLPFLFFGVLFFFFFLMESYYLENQLVQNL